MTEAGLACIERQNKMARTILDEVEELIVPLDLETEFTNHPTAKNFFESSNKSFKSDSILAGQRKNRRNTTKTTRRNIRKNKTKNQNT